VLRCAVLCCWQVRRLGLKCALSAKANEGRLILVDSLTPLLPKTKVMAGKLQALLDLQAANSLTTASKVFRNAKEAGCSSLVSRQRMLAVEDARVLRQGGKKKKKKKEVQQQQLEASAHQESGNGSLLQEQEQQEVDPLELQRQQEAAERAERKRRKALKAAQAAAPRLNAVLIDAAKDGDDGGELMRRAVKNLPGELWHVWRVESFLQNGWRREKACQQMPKHRCVLLGILVQAASLTWACMGMDVTGPDTSAWSAAWGWHRWCRWCGWQIAG
jgi:hypothetical protein